MDSSAYVEAFTSQVLSKHLKDDGDGRGEAGNEAALIAQVRYLSQQFHMLTTSPGSVTVVHTGSNTGSTFTSFVIPAAVVGAAGYGYMWWRGFSWGDVMYVTRKNMNNAVAGVGKQLEHVSAALQSTKRHLTQRLDSVTRTLDDSVAMTGLIKDQVYEVKGEVERSVYEIETVQRQIEGLEVKMDAVTEKQNFANQGIMILIRCVDRLNLLNGQQPELVQGFQSWMLNAGTLERTSSSPTVCGTPGLKELQFFSQVLEPKSPSVASTAEISTPLKSNIDCKPSVGLAGTITPGPSVQRTFSASMMSRMSLSRFQTSAANLDGNR